MAKKVTKVTGSGNNNALSGASPLESKLVFKCKTPKQKELTKTIQEKEITFITGPAGTGKSYVSIATALGMLKEPGSPFKKIVLIYPVEIDKTESIGFLKGTLEEKLEPYYEADFYTMEKIFNASGIDGKGAVAKLVAAGQIEIKSAGFLRGSTLDDSIVIVSEAQNFTKSTFLKILTRIGSSKYIFNADENQLDADSIKTKSREAGLRYAIDKLSGLDEIGTVEFTISDVVRNPLISKILACWDPELYEEKKQE